MKVYVDFLSYFWRFGPKEVLFLNVWPISNKSCYFTDTEKCLTSLLSCRKILSKVGKQYRELNFITPEVVLEGKRKSPNSSLKHICDPGWTISLVSKMPTFHPTSEYLGSIPDSSFLPLQTLGEVDVLWWFMEWDPCLLHGLEGLIIIPASQASISLSPSFSLSLPPSPLPQKIKQNA